MFSSGTYLSLLLSSQPPPSQNCLTSLPSRLRIGRGDWKEKPGVFESTQVGDKGVEEVIHLMRHDSSIIPGVNRSVNRWKMWSWGRQTGVLGSRPQVPPWHHCILPEQGEKKKKHKKLLSILLSIMQLSRLDSKNWWKNNANRITVCRVFEIICVMFGYSCKSALTALEFDPLRANLINEHTLIFLKTTLIFDRDVALDKTAPSLVERLHGMAQLRYYASPYHRYPWYGEHTEPRFLPEWKISRQERTLGVISPTLTEV